MKKILIIFLYFAFCSYSVAQLVQPTPAPSGGTLGTTVNIAGSVTTIPAGGSTWPVSGTVSLGSTTVNIGNFPSIQPISGTVSLGSTIVTLGATTVNIGNFPSTQGVSGTVSALQSVANWSVNHTQIKAVAVSTGVGTSDTGTQRVAVSQDSSLSLGSSTSKTIIVKSGSTTVATTATTPILSYTATSGKTFYLNYLSMEGSLSTISATASLIGTVYLTHPMGGSIQHNMMNSTTSEADRIIYAFADPLVVQSSSTVTVKVDPASATSTFFKANFGGYEK